MLLIRLHIIKALAILAGFFPGEVAPQKMQDMTGTIIIKNKHIELQVDRPLENYNFSRFDWTGKIVAVKYKGVYVSGIEKMNPDNENSIGKGFYNEFGIDKPVGFDEATVGGWFHKIGIGALKKEDEAYDFSKKYEIKPAEFDVSVQQEKVTIKCTSPQINGYAYALTKTIALLEDGFEINYRLENTGENRIITNEYCHNFLSINRQLIGTDYVLRFPFDLNTESFNAIVNPEKMVTVGNREFRFTGNPEAQFFFSNLTGGNAVGATWELHNNKSNIGIRETGNFETSLINLWGWKHVISPELFFDINIDPGGVVEWSRVFTLFEIDK